MQISVVEKEKSGVCLQLPTGLLLNRLTAGIVARKLRKQGMQISGKSVYAFAKAVRTYRKEHPQWQLVEVQSANGEQIQVNL